MAVNGPLSAKHPSSPKHKLAMRFHRIFAIVCLLACVFQLTEAPVGQARADTYKHDGKGLQKQFDPFLKAVPNGGPDRLKDSFTEFALPNPEAWFGEYFSKDQVAQLLRDNEADLDKYRNSLTNGIRRFLQPPYWVRCKLETHLSTTLKPRTDAIQPITAPPIEQYTITFTGANGRSMFQLGNFVYVDGAFRYLGGGAYPFWSMPDVEHRHRLD